ncbi:MAG: hypothetical protein JW839_10085 [Candidatus Lokiarchaeota archaeon]|nr:hypothetical protein [Candidatus Lokiarchaeota archaeon]
MLVTIAIFVLIFGVGQELPREPIHDVIYAIGVGMVYTAIGLMVFQARRREAEYRKPVDDPAIARKLTSKTILEAFLFTAALATSIYAVVGIYVMLHAVPIFGGSPPASDVDEGMYVLPAMLCFFVAFFTFLAGAGVHTSIAELRRKYHTSNRPPACVPSAPLAGERPFPAVTKPLATPRAGRSTVNILAFSLSAGLAIVAILLILSLDEKLKYHDFSEGMMTVVVGLVPIFGMLVGLMHLLHSLPPKSQANTPHSTARANLARVGALIAIFAVVGGLGFQNESYVLSQPTPSESDLYLTHGFLMHANSSTIPTVLTRTWDIPDGQVDDIEVHVDGIATAPCGNFAVINYSIAFSCNGSIPLGPPYARYSTNASDCDGGVPSKVTLGWEWWGFPVASMDNVSLTMTLYPHPANTGALLNVTIYKINKLNLLHWDKFDVIFMYGAVTFAGWFYAAVGTLSLLVGLKRLRDWKNEYLSWYWGSTRVWARDATDRDDDQGAS